MNSTRNVVVWNSLDEVPQNWPGCVVTIGVFDGFHRGHQALVRAARERAHRLGVPLVLMTFDPHPRAITRPESAPTLLLPVHDRVAMAHTLGADVVLVVPFTRDFAAMAAEDFVDQTLIASLKAKAVVIGANFRFGANGQGDVAMLRTSGTRGGFDVDVVAPLQTAGRTCSSTEVRRCVAAGDTRTTQALLGRPHLRRLNGLAALDSQV